MRESKDVRIDVSFGDNTAVISRSNRSQKVVADVLGRETDPVTGKQTIWLDRMVHRAGEDTMFSGDKVFSVDGAISSVLIEK